MCSNEVWSHNVNSCGRLFNQLLASTKRKTALKFTCKEYYKIHIATTRVKPRSKIRRKLAQALN